MKKVIVGVMAAAAFAVPVAAFADNSQLIALYQQLVAVLQQQLSYLQQNQLSITPQTGKAPLEVTFTVDVRQGNEAIDYGDGHSSGSGGCKTNAQGHCDLSQPVKHTYALPGTYKVSLLRTINGKASTVMTSTVTVQ